MNRFAKRFLPLLLCVLLCLSACHSQKTNEEESSDMTTTVTESDTVGTTGGDPIVSTPTLSDYLISSWDFKGDTKSEMLSDKASNGDSKDAIKLNGKASVSNGVLRIEDEKNAYASIECAEGSDLYDLTNKTIVFKARIFNAEDETVANAVASLLSKKSTYNINLSNAVSNRQVSVVYQLGDKSKTLESTTTVSTEEWFVYAISMEFNAKTRTGVLNVYKSSIENPDSQDDYQLIVSKELSSLPLGFFQGTDALYLGKRHNHLSQRRTLISEFSAIQVYSKALTLEELATVSIGNNANTDALLTDLNALLSEAEQMEQGVHSNQEWAALTTVITNAKALNAQSTVAELQAAITELRRQIVLMTIQSVPSSIGDITMLPYNNADATVPIQVGLHCYPGLYDMDGDGDLDLIAYGNSNTYGGSGGGNIFAFRNLSGEKSTTVFGQAEKLFSGSDTVWWSYKKDGTAVFVDEKGVMHTSVSNAGFDQGDAINGLNTLFKLYDVDGDGLSDAVMLSKTAYGTEEYDQNGIWQAGNTYQFKWIKNTGTEANPVFTSSAKTIVNSLAEPFTIDDGTKYADVRSFCMFDWDGDGDLDLIAGGMMNEFYYYENKGTAAKPVFDYPGVKIETPIGALALDCCRYNAINYDWDGDGKDDLLIGGESGTVLYLRFTGQFNQTTHAPIFEEGVYFTKSADYVAVNALSRPTACDWDGDGDEDLIVGDNSGFLWLVENLTGGADPSWAPPVRLADENGTPLVIKAGPSESLQGDYEAEWGYTIPCACDWDGDGDVDILVNSVTGRVVWFENIGTKTNPQLPQPKAIEVEWEGENLYPTWQWWKPEGKELVTQHRSTVYGIDLNKDGLCDLVALDHEGYLAFYERYSDNGALKLKQGERIFLNENGTSLRLNSKTDGQSGRKKFVIADWNGDGMLDVIVDSTSFDLYQTIKIENGKYYLKSQGALTSAKISGHNHGFTVVDWDKDGDCDILSGTEAGYLYYFENKTK